MPPIKTPTKPAQRVPSGAAPVKGGKKKNGKAPPSPPKEEVKEVVDLEIVTQPERKVIYPHLEVYHCYKGGKEGPINIDLAKKFVGWETESEYVTRMTANMSEKEKAKVNVKFQDWLLIDEYGEKIKCWSNDNNRPFTESHARKLGQDQLNRQWAGPTTMPNETVNGETIIISRTGRVTSGQHRLIGFILACQIWAGKNKNHWKEKWPSEPILESLVVVGVSDSPKVIQTLDNTKPRTLSDTFYTSEIFQALAPGEKRECSRMLEKAVEFLWIRSGAGTGSDSFNKYQTHSVSREFLDRHPKLLECVTHLFGENKERSISALKLSPGQCAGALYIMGSSASDGNVYRNQEPPREEALDWSAWKDAMNFWSLVSNTKDPQLETTRKALGSLVDEDTATGGRAVEKFCVLAKSWKGYQDGLALNEEELALEYVDRDDGRHLAEWPDFGGMDIGPKHKEPDPEPPSEEAIAQAKETKRKEMAKAMAERFQAMRAKKNAAG